MIIIAGTVPIDPTKKADALKLMKAMYEASEREQGCISYRFYLNPWDESQVMVFEEWESAEALEAHFRAEHMEAFRKQLPNYVTGPMQIKRYEVSSVADA